MMPWMPQTAVTFRLYLLLACFAWLFPHFGQAQDAVVEGKVIDASNGQGLPFGHVVIKNRPSVISTTNQNGGFSITARAGDTLTVSYVGYRTSHAPIRDVNSKVLLRLDPRSIAIGTVEITEESDFLYALLSRSRTSKSPYTEKAKSYLFLESAIEGKTTEMIEAYYNGQFKGYDLESLALKNGRIGLQSFESQYFINMASSRAVMMHALLSQSDYFPESPLGKSKRKLKKTFKLTYSNRFKNEQNGVVYQIDFRPKENPRRHFEGSVWIDSASANIQKIEMQAADTYMHPFVPLFPDAKIEKIDLFIRKTFTKKGDFMYPREIDFNYEMVYRRANGAMSNIKTKSLLYAFQYEEEFNLPYIYFPEGMSNDYRKINALPQNLYFWSHKPFLFKDEEGKVESFFNSDSTLLANDVVYSKMNRRSFFEHPYVIWRGNRIRMRNMERVKQDPIALAKQKENCHAEEIDVPIDGYHLEVQLFMDLYDWDDSLYISTAAIFDPFESYFYAEHDKTTTVFLNIYFDLAEIQNRKLHQALRGVNKVEKAKATYEDINQEFKEISKAYFSTVMKGKDRSALMSWNDLVREKLGIDNVAIFGLTEDEEEH